MRRLMPFLVLVTVLCHAAPSSADFLEYRLGGGRLRILLQGKTQANPGGTLTFTHAKFGKIHFSLKEVKIHDVPTLPQQFQKRMVIAKKEPNGIFEAGVWALKHGMLPEYYQAVDEVLKVDPKHAESLRIKALKRDMDKPLSNSDSEEKHLRSFVPRPNMKIAKSKHFILLYDTPDKVDKNDKGHKKPRHEERLELLERVYESFLLTFLSRGVDLEVPKERLEVVLFQQHADYLDFSRRLSPELINTAGFYLPETNISFFFDQGTSETFEELKKLNNELQDVKKDSIKARTAGTKHVVRLADTIQVLILVAQESQDVEVVSHECTHQLAANTGLFPRHVNVPSWVHEGLAAYFESPNDGAWSGIGAVNEKRLDYYRALEPDREHSNIDFIVGDQIFDYAGSLGATLHGYGQAWALTHFLMEKHFTEFMRYYKQLGEMPPDVNLSPDLLKTLFDNTFGSDRAALDGEWRSYMRSLKTDEELVMSGR